MTSEKLEGIREIIEGMEMLQEGKHLVVSHEDPEQLQRIRLWIYEWLFSQGRKREFRIKFLEATKIAVMKRGQAGVDVERPVEHKVDEVIQLLLDRDDPFEGLVEMFRKGEIKALEFERIDKELRRILE